MQRIATNYVMSCSHFCKQTDEDFFALIDFDAFPKCFIEVLQPKKQLMQNQSAIFGIRFATTGKIQRDLLT